MDENQSADESANVYVHDVDMHNHGHSTESDELKGHESLRSLIESVAFLLPAQGPITAFVHHNTLHAFESMPFDAAVKRGARVFGCQPYLAEKRYRQLVEEDRIRSGDIVAVLMEDLDDRCDELIGGFGSRLHLRMAMLQYPLQMAPSAELRWLVAETEALQKFRSEAPVSVRRTMIDNTQHWAMRDLFGELSDSDQGRRSNAKLSLMVKRFGREPIERWNDTTWEALCLRLLWQVCRDGVHEVTEAAAPRTPPVRHRDILLHATSEDSDLLVHDFLVRLCAAFLDQGMANWTLPHRDLGFYRAFLTLYEEGGGPVDRWLHKLPRELQRLSKSEIGPIESIEESLRDLGVEPAETERFVAESLLALRGWAGMIWQLETRGDRVAHPAPEGTLVEFLAIRLILERMALIHVARAALGYRGPLSELRKIAGKRNLPKASPSVEQVAFLVFQLAQVLGWTPQQLHELSASEWSQLVREIEEFPSLERRRIYHAAYERRYNVQLLDAVSIHAARVRPPKQTPDFQIAFCIDDREESFRRHLEEIAPNCETFGYAGFYGVAMYYRGAAEAHYLPLCPVIIKPNHYVREEVSYTFGDVHRRRSETRRALATASHRWHVGSRTFIGGILTAQLGALASIPMVARILFPRLTAQICRRFGRFIQPPPVTQLKLERQDPLPGPAENQIGYSVDEMATIVERGLRDMGLTSNFSRLVIITGHGSSSMNNPHESAYNCGACAGGRGGPNARAFAQMANDPRIRHTLNENGMTVPWTTVFIGAYHDTCNDSVIYYDLDRLPSSHWNDFDRVKEHIDEARERNAHERCRRFVSADLLLTPEQALRHVESRAENLSEARPEYNHATNAVTIVGRRWRTQGLFLDRRAFLASYDPEADDERYTILTRILQAVIPVCAGISLEYYFSCVDPDGWGCGSKLPHNVTSLLGVMAGASSDLRPGLSQQMIEIHEPMRPVFIIETTPEAMFQIMEENEGIRNLCANHWVYLAVLDPESLKIQLYRNGKFEVYAPETHELPVKKSSADWFRGWRDNLGFASIGPNLNASGGNGQPVSDESSIGSGAERHGK